MLTKLTIRGFKNIIDATVEFGPYTCIAGPNAVGKSNLFDAIEFLSLLADHPFLEAARLLRPSGGRSSDPVTMFALDGEGKTGRTIELVAEMLIGKEVTDDFGTTASPRSTLLRYTIELEHIEVDRSTPGKPSGLALVREELTPISKGDAHLHIRWPHSAKNFRQLAVVNNRFSGAYVSTEVLDGQATLLIHADGGSRGNPRRSPIVGAARSALSSVSSADEPTMLAVRQEMRSWRKLALEPSSMREPDELFSPTTTVSTSGGHLAATLWRLEQRDQDASALVAANLAELADVRDVRVVTDERRDLLTLEARLGDGPFLPARSLSEGTLRFLSLALIETDPLFHGLICMEEPENGIHPAKIPAMVDLLRRLAIDPSDTPGEDNPLRQVIVNTHSPELVRAQHTDDLLIAMQVDYRQGGRNLSGVNFFPMTKSWRAKSGGPTATAYTVESYLSRDAKDSPVWQALKLDLEV